MSTTRTHVSKKHRVVSNGDRISNLYESVITHVLSLLLAKDAVRTCILSKDWEYKWKSLYRVDIEDVYACNHKDESFIKFMDRLFLHCKHIKMFRICCNRLKDSSCMETWISDALRHDLESFSSYVDRPYDTVYPCSLLNSPNLRKLWLAHYGATLRIAVTNCVPKLTTLYLYGVKIVNLIADSSTVTLNCPVLEKLTFRGCSWLGVKHVQINAPLLTTFKSKPEGWHRNIDYEYCFELYAPKLKTFKCSRGLFEKFVLNGSSIVSASLLCDGEVIVPQLYNIMGLRARDLLNRLTSLEKLELSSHMSKVSQSVLPLPTYDKLIRLSFLNGVCAGQMLKYLHAAPSLKFLMVSLFDLDEYDYGAIEVVPSCIASHLEEVVLQDFEGDIYPYDLANFLIKTAKQLKKVVILGSRPIHESFKEVLSTFPRCSPSLTIHIREKY